MIKKTLVLGLVIFGLLSFSTLSVTAVEDEMGDELDDVTYTDEAGNIEEVSDKPNLDIEKLYWSRNEQTVTLTLTVKGEIENRGSTEILKLMGDAENYFAQKLEEFDGNETALINYLLGLDFNATTYEFVVETIENTYSIMYTNEEILIVDSFSVDEIPGSFSFDGSDLTITFDLIDEGDQIANLSTNTMEITETTSYVDDLFGEAEDLTKKATSTDNGSPGFEMIAVIAAIAIAFIILRRKK